MLTIECTKKLWEKLNMPIENIDFNEINPLYSWHVTSLYSTGKMVLF